MSERTSTATKQPKWRYITNLGDVNYLEYGGAFVFEDETGVYAPELEIYDRDGNSMSRVVLEPHTYENGVLSDNPYHKDMEAWYASKLPAVADCVGHDVELIRTALCSSQPVDRAIAYTHLIAYFGVFEFDNYPVKLTPKEARERYAKLLKGRSA